MQTMANVGILFWLAPLWPLAAIATAVFLYVRHCRLIEPDRRVSVIIFVVAAIVFAGLFGFLGIVLGIDWACAGRDAGNLCGLVGFLVTGPIAGSLGVVLVALALSLVRPQEQAEWR
jgi:hypothetical protein